MILGTGTNHFIKRRVLMTHRVVCLCCCIYRAAHKVSNLSPISRVHLVFDLCEEPHPRVDVPPGTVCDYDMEQGLLCQYPEGAAPLVMPPVHWVDAATAAVEAPLGSTTAAAAALQQVEDNGTDYVASDDALPTNHVTSVRAGLLPIGRAPNPVKEQLQAAPTPEQRGALEAQHHPGDVLLLLPGGAAEVDAANVFGTVGNGQASTWVTAAMHPQSSLQFS